jgi:hypothetical protein
MAAYLVHLIAGWIRQVDAAYATKELGKTDRTAPLAATTVQAAVLRIFVQTV